MSSLPSIIGISGKRGSGKLHLAQFIIKLRPEYELVSLSAAVKEITSILTSTSYEDQWNQARSKKPPPFDRTLAQYHQILSQNLRELIHPHIWIDIVMRHPGKFKVIYDIQYETDIKAIEAAGGVVLRLERPDTDFDESYDPTHISECDLDNYPFQFKYYNNGNVEDLEEFATGWIQEITM